MPTMAAAACVAVSKRLAALTVSIAKFKGDHGVRAAVALRRGVGFDAAAVGAGTFGGGENRGEPVRAQRGALALSGPRARFTGSYG